MSRFQRKGILQNVPTTILYLISYTFKDISEHNKKHNEDKNVNKKMLTLYTTDPVLDKKKINKRSTA